MNTVSLGTRTIVMLLVVLLLGGLLRSWHATENMRFTGDEARDLIQAKNIITKGQFPVLGPKIFRGQGHLGPAYAYGMAVPLALAGYDPAVSVILVILFDLLALLLLFFLGRLLYDVSTGLLAAGLYAVCFTMIFYARWGWHPSFIPFFVLLCFLAMLLLLRGHCNWLPVLAVGLGLAVQFHISAVLLFLPAMLTLWSARHCLSRGRVILSITLWAVVSSPLLAFEAYSGFQNLRNMLQLQPVLLGTPAAPFPPFLADIAQAVAEQAYWPYGERRILLDAWIWIYPINVLLVVLALLNGLRELPRGGMPLLILLSWVVLFPLSLAGLSSQRSHYYLLAWFPLVILLVGRFLSVLLSYRFLRLAGGALAVLLVTVNLLSYTQYFRVITQADYDTFLAGPLTMKKEAVHLVAADAKEAPFGVEIVSWHWCNHWPYLYLFSNQESRPSKTVVTSIDLQNGTRAEDLVNTSHYFIAPQAEGNLTWYTIVEPATLHDQARFEKQWDVGQLRVYKNLTPDRISY